MKRTLIAAALVAILVAAPVYAGYKLVAQGMPTAVGKSTLTVTPARQWNRLGQRVGRNAETWTLDGSQLNDVTFFGGIANDTTLFKDSQKRDRPLPRFASSMLAPDVAQLFEGSYRVALGTSLMSIDSIEPAQFAGNQGFKFTYSFTIQGEEVRRKGEAHGAIIGGKLYLITYEAPQIHYYDRDIGAYRDLVATARVATARK
jgi:hypothetical protein